MTKFTKKQAIKIVCDCAVKYKEDLLDRSFLFMTTDKHKCLIPIEVFFTKRNYLHLTGLKVDKSIIPANRFFELCIDGKLSPDDFEFDKRGTTDLKLAILPYLINKNLSANSIGDFNKNGIDLYTEKLIGNVKGCVGFRTDESTGLFMPNTVLNKDIRECIKHPLLRIIATYRKNSSDDFYSEIVYTAKKIEWDKIQFPEKYSYLPKPTK